MSELTQFLSTADWTPESLQTLLDMANGFKHRRITANLGGKGLGLIFFNPSLRTRTSFQVAMAQLGGHSVVLEVGGGVWDLEVLENVVMDGARAEHVREAAPVLSRYLDCLAVRCFGAGQQWQEDRKDPILRGFSRHTDVPLINMESSVWHPCQALADALTWQELGLERGSKLVLTWAYHPRALPTAVPNSVVVMAAQRGLNLHILRPPEFGLDPEVMQLARDRAGTTGGAISETSDRSCLEGAQVVYAKSWGSLAAYGRPGEEQQIREACRDWQVTETWMEEAGQARFMHCLPVRRNVVVSDGVLDSPRSAIVDQAENRLHVQKALLATLMNAQLNSLE